MKSGKNQSPTTRQFFFPFSLFCLFFTVHGPSLWDAGHVNSKFLFPFLIVNGILTGSFIDEPVVWYNNAENLSLRFITIPVEDFIYGLLLFLMNVTIYEKILSRGSKRLAD